MTGDGSPTSPASARLIAAVGAGFKVAAVMTALIGSYLDDEKPRILAGMLAGFFLFMDIVPSIFQSQRSWLYQGQQTAVWGAAAGVCAQLMLWGGLQWVATPTAGLVGAALGALSVYGYYWRLRLIYGDRF